MVYLMKFGIHNLGTQFIWNKSQKHPNGYKCPKMLKPNIKKSNKVKYLINGKRW